jgi:dienelactone hydrolase
MAEVVLFHHALGLTDGVRAFADRLRSDGHVVHTPDLFDAHTFSDVEDGVRHAERIGFGEIIERGVRFAAGLTSGLVYAGFSLGVLPAQCLAQTRAGARGALLFHSCVPLAEFGTSWPAGVPVQVHAMEQDPFFVDDGDAAAAEALVASTPGAELFLYPGAQHLFAEVGAPSFDAPATALLLERTLQFLAAVR